MSGGPPRIRVADVFRAYWPAFLRKHRVASFHHKAVTAILQCRTPALGGHPWQCGQCGHQAVLYNSCRNRHCPTCQGAAREQWLAKRMRELIPAPYYHLVFTLPHALNPLIRHNRRTLIGLFFREVNATLQEFGHDPQWRLEGQIGFIAVLHTWSQTLINHFHLHCAVPGGAWRDGTWVAAKRNWLFRAESLAARFRNRYLRALRRLLERGKLDLPATPRDWVAVCSELAATDWVVYAKKPFAGAAQVMEYLGRYTHKVAISDYRILNIADGKVSFRYRDRASPEGFARTSRASPEGFARTSRASPEGFARTSRVSPEGFARTSRADGDREKIMTLDAEAFIGRFLLHILPTGMQKIRFYGWMARTVRTANIEAIWRALNCPPPEEPPPTPPCRPICPRCGKPAMEKICRRQSRGPPPLPP